jgi:PAS domain S-box-containing protein
MRLIIIVASVISGFVVIGLIFFQATRKTYPGFGRWTAGVGFLTVGYLALALRGFIPDSLSIMIGNAAFPLGMVFLLDGLRQFLGATSMSKLWYALPVADLAATAILYYAHDSAYCRTVVTAIAIAAPHWPMAALIFRHPVEHKSIFYPVIGCLLGLGGLVVLARPISALFLPQWHLFMDSPFQLGSLITLIVLQLGESLSLMMLNSERVESELKDAQAELRLTVDRLQQALTEREKAEADLRLSEAKFLDLYENAPCAYFSVWTDGTIRLCNRHGGELLGYSREELIGKPVFELYADEPEGQEKARKVFKRFVDGEPIADEELRMQKADGSLVWVSLTVNGIRDSIGHTVGSRSMVLDISDRKRAQEERQSLRNQLLQAQKMEAIGTLTGGIAHDFNNLLQIINGYTEMILMDRKEDDPIYADLKKVHGTGLKGAEMVQRLLSFSEKAPVSLQPLYLNDIVENSVKLMENTFPKMIEIETVLSDDLGMINGDASHIEQLLMNLCINAQEAMPDGGRLRIETRNIVVDGDYCRLHVGARPGRYSLIEVSDTGVGMSKEIMDRGFDPFFTTKGWDFKKGTGLGLSVTKGIVEQHGGWIVCESKEGVGTTFSVYLPVIEDLLVTRTSEPMAETAPNGRKILLVDDEEHVRDLGKRILEHAGYRVITAGNGKEAVEIYAKEQSEIALVVLDLVMPKMGGEKCLDELVKINPHVKVIISTGRSLDAQERLHLGSLARGFVNKPYEVGQMVQAVRKVLGSGGPNGDRLPV